MEEKPMEIDLDKLRGLFKADHEKKLIIDEAVKTAGTALSTSFKEN